MDKSSNYNNHMLSTIPYDLATWAVAKVSCWCETSITVFLGWLIWNTNIRLLANNHLPLNTKVKTTFNVYLFILFSNAGVSFNYKNYVQLVRERKRESQGYEAGKKEWDEGIISELRWGREEEEELSHGRRGGIWDGEDD